MEGHFAPAGYRSSGTRTLSVAPAPPPGFVEPLESRRMFAAGDELVGADLVNEGTRQGYVAMAAQSWLPDDWFSGGEDDIGRPRGTARQYDRLISRIQKRAITGEDLEALQVAIPNRSEFEVASKTLLLIANGGGSEAAYDRLYRRVVQAKPSPSVLFDRLSFQVDALLKNATRKPERASNRFAWQGGSMMLSMMRAYEATGQQRFLDLFVRAFDPMLSTRNWHMRRTEENRGRRMKTWGNDEDGRWTAYVTHVGRLGYPVGLFAEAVRTDKTLRAAYAGKASRYIAAIEESLAEFDDDYRTTGKGKAAEKEGYYIRAAAGDVEPLNHASTVGNALVVLHRITGKEKYRVRAEQIANYFKSAIRVEKNGTYTWGYQPTPENRIDHAPEMIYKAEVTMSFAVVAQKYGIGFTKRDLRILAQSFLTNVYDKSGDFNEWIGTRRYNPKAEGAKPVRDRLTAVAGWMVLDHVEPRLRRAVEMTVFNRTDEFPDAWMTDVKSMEIYAHRMTRLPAAKKATATAERRLAQKSSSSAASPAPAVAAAISFGDALIQHDDALDLGALLSGATRAILS